MKLYEVDNYNCGIHVKSWLNPAMITKADTGSRIAVTEDHSCHSSSYKTISEKSVWVYLQDRSSVRITWEAWEKLRAAAGIEVEVL